MIAAMGFGFTITGTRPEFPKQPLSVFVTVTKCYTLVPVGI